MVVNGKGQQHIETVVDSLELLWCRWRVILTRDAELIPNISMSQEVRWLTSVFNGSVQPSNRGCP